ncbi:13221_t:CDS:2, partial [Dentiscutata erythropus]
ASIHEYLFPASLQLFADSLGRNLTDSIPVKILGDRDMGLDLFGD